MTIVGAFSVVVMTSLIAVWLNDNFSFGGSTNFGDEIIDS
jgi:hypothetical protein